MEVAEVGADDVPVRLLALQVQFDEVDEDPLQVVAQLGWTPESPGFPLRYDVFEKIDVLMTSSTPPKLESLQIRL